MPVTIHPDVDELKILAALERINARLEAIEQALTARPEYLDTIAAAKYCGISKEHLEALRCKGAGPRSYKLGRLVKYSRDDLDAWVRSNAHGGDDLPEFVTRRARRDTKE